MNEAEEMQELGRLIIQLAEENKKTPKELVIEALEAYESTLQVNINQATTKKQKVSTGKGEFIK